MQDLCRNYHLITSLLHHIYIKLYSLAKLAGVSRDNNCQFFSYDKETEKPKFVINYVIN